MTTLAKLMENQTATSPTLPLMDDSQKGNTSEGGTTSSAFGAARLTTPLPTVLTTIPSQNRTYATPTPKSSEQKDSGKA